MAGMSHIMDNHPLTILKRDNRGRVRSTPEAREAAVAEFQRSGLSACAFAKMAGIPTNTFWNWLHDRGLTQKRGSVTAAKASSSVRFVQVCAPQAAAASAPALLVRLPGCAVLEVTDASQIVLAAQLLKALA